LDDLEEQNDEMPVSATGNFHFIMLLEFSKGLGGESGF